MSVIREGNDSSIARVFDTILSVPGMDRKMKVTLSISRKNILLLSRVIERGTGESVPDQKSAEIIEAFGQEGIRELYELAKVLLEKAELAGVNEMLKSF